MNNNGAISFEGGAGHSPNFGSGFNLYERIWQFFESGDDL